MALRWALSGACNCSWHRVAAASSERNATDLSLFEIPTWLLVGATRLGADLTGSVPWEGSKVLAQHIVQLQHLPKSVVELGAGLGVVGLTAAAMGSKVVLTDMRPSILGRKSNVLLELMELNAETNNLDKAVTVRELEWGNKDHIEDLIAHNNGGFDMIFGADLLYHEATLPALVETIVALRKPGGDTMVVLSQAFEARRSVASFHAVVADHGFNLEVLDTQGVTLIVSLTEESRESWHP
jgi:predicted nicotinamide N-methyase